jgi:hypothetical protein
MSDQFSLGLTYWPRRTAHNWWEQFDRGEVQEELEHIATLGFDTVRFCLRWEVFHPQRDRIGSAAMRALEHALDAAQHAKLRVAAVLFPAALDGSIQVPSWVNRGNIIGELQRAARVGSLRVVRPALQPPVIYEHRYHTNYTHDLFNDRDMLDAQRYFVREVAGYFDQHPALWAWQIGEGLEYVHRPGSAEAVRDWLATISEALRNSARNARLLGVTTARGLTTRPGPRPEHIVESCSMLGVAADPPLPLPNLRPLHVAYVAYMHALAASLSEKPALVTSLGLPTAPDGHAAWISDSAYGQPTHAYLGNEEEQATFIEQSLTRLQQAGALGAWLASYADYSTEHWRIPPFDRVTRTRTLGVVAADGREKPVAEVVRNFAAARHTVAAHQPLRDLDPERYWRDPKRAFAAFWREFQET